MKVTGKTGKSSRKKSQTKSKLYSDSLNIYFTYIFCSASNYM